MDMTNKSARSLKQALAPLLVALSPVIILAAAFVVAQERVLDAAIEGVPLTEFFIASALVVPLLSQAISAAVFGALRLLNSSETAGVSQIVLRYMPRGLVPAAVFALLAGAGLGFSRSWPIFASAALVWTLFIHLVLALSLVVAFAARRYFRLPIAWAAYGAAMIFAPQLWWLPALCALFTQIVLMVLDCHSPKPGAEAILVERAWHLPLPGTWMSMRRAVGGLADAMPIWSMPLMMWVVLGDHFDPGAAMFAVLPAILGMQVFFVMLVDPLWARIKVLTERLVSEPYSLVRNEARGLGGFALRGSAFVILFTGIIGLVATLMWLFVIHTEVPELFVAKVVASGAGAVVAMLGYLYSMFRDRRWVFVSAVAAGTVHIGALTLAVEPQMWLSALSVTFGVLALVYLAVSVRDWRHPEYHLFWARAIAA